jgi:nucleoside-diphosphate-sugar epimerase
LFSIHPGNKLKIITSFSFYLLKVHHFHIIAGSSTYPNLSFGWVNVKDVALAHILAYEVPSANGRYCMVERVVHYSELVNIIRNMYPTIRLLDK